MKKIAVIDEETNAELAQLGVCTVRRLVLCNECRFRTGETMALRGGPQVVDICVVNRRQWCTVMNPNGECTKFEPLPEPLPLIERFKFAAYIGSSFILGLVLGALLF